MEWGGRVRVVGVTQDYNCVIIDVRRENRRRAAGFGRATARADVGVVRQWEERAKADSPDDAASGVDERASEAMV